MKKMRYEAFRGVYKFENTRKNFKLILVLMIVFVLESKGRNDVWGTSAIISRENQR